jgi:hypothetical protein
MGTSRPQPQHFDPTPCVNRYLAGAINDLDKIATNLSEMKGDYDAAVGQLTRTSSLDQILTEIERLKRNLREIALPTPSIDELMEEMHGCGLG